MVGFYPNLHPLCEFVDSSWASLHYLAGPLFATNRILKNHSVRFDIMQVVQYLFCRVVLFFKVGTEDLPLVWILQLSLRHLLQLASFLSLEICSNNSQAFSQTYNQLSVKWDIWHMSYITLELFCNCPTFLSNPPNSQQQSWRLPNIVVYGLLPNPIFTLLSLHL